MSDTVSPFGRKVFFLNPPSVLAEVLPTLANAEFEVYQSTDHARLARYLGRDPACLVFVNIDEGDDESAWRAWIKKLREDTATAAVAFGILTMLPDEDKRNAYLMELGASCGFITVSSGAAKTTEILLRTLEANEARGRRRFVRVNCPPEAAVFNCRIDADIHRGSIRDLSSVGMSVCFDETTPPSVGMRLKDIQLNLKGNRLSLNGVVMGGRDDAESSGIRLIMFEPASVDQEKRDKLRAFIRKTLQAGMDAVLERS